MLAPPGSTTNTIEHSLPTLPNNEYCTVPLTHALNNAHVFNTVSTPPSLPHQLEFYGVFDPFQYPTTFPLQRRPYTRG